VGSGRNKSYKCGQKFIVSINRKSGVLIQDWFKDVKVKPGLRIPLKRFWIRTCRWTMIKSCSKKKVRDCMIWFMNMPSKVKSGQFSLKTIMIFYW